MKLGLQVGLWGFGVSGEDQLRMAQAADELGYDSVWVSEAYGSDAATVLAWIASNTERVRIGSGIFQMPARTPAMTAMTAATLDNISNGRMICGLGISGPQVVESWHGQPFDKPRQRTREYVAIMRKALGRETVTYDGEFYKLPVSGGQGRPLKLIINPVQERIPIYIAAVGLKNTALAGEIADGWLAMILSLEHMDTFRSALGEGAARGGRSLDDLDMAPIVWLAIDADHNRARDLMRPALALYIGGMGSREHNFYNQLVTRYGYGKVAKRVQDLYLDQRYDEAMAAIPSELIDRVTLAGPPELIHERLGAYRDAGVGTLIISPIADSIDDRLRMMLEMAELAGVVQAAAAG